MKRLFLLIALLILLPVCCYADFYNSPVSVTAESYPHQIPTGSVCVNPGVYVIGTDIPSGSYQIDMDCYGCQIIVKSDRGKVLFSDLLGKNYYCTRVTLNLSLGYTVKISHNPVYFSPASPFDPSSVLPGIYITDTDIPAGTYLFSSESSTVYLNPLHGYFSDRFEVDTDNFKIDLPPDSALVIYNKPVAISDYTAPSFNWE